MDIEMPQRREFYEKNFQGSFVSQKATLDEDEGTMEIQSICNKPGSCSSCGGDHRHDLCPMKHWTLQEVMDYFREQGHPYFKSKYYRPMKNDKSLHSLSIQEKGPCPHQLVHQENDSCQASREGALAEYKKLVDKMKKLRISHLGEESFIYFGEEEEDLMENSTRGNDTSRSFQEEQVVGEMEDQEEEDVGIEECPIKDEPMKGASNSMPQLVQQHLVPESPSLESHTLANDGIYIKVQLDALTLQVGEEEVAHVNLKTMEFSMVGVERAQVDYKEEEEWYKVDFIEEGALGGYEVMYLPRPPKSGYYIRHFSSMERCFLWFRDGFSDWPYGIFFP